MATRLQALKLGAETIWVEVDDALAVVEGGESRFAKTSASGEQKLKVASADIDPTLRAVLEPVRGVLSEFKAEEFTVELTIGIKAEVGFFLAKGESNAALKITAKWKS